MDTLEPTLEVSMLEKRLHELIPDKYSTFPKLTKGHAPYQYRKWQKTTRGQILYYWLTLTHKDSKGVSIADMRKTLAESLESCAFDRKVFNQTYPRAESQPCDFTVIGRCIEYLGVAQYAGSKEGFIITDGNRIKELLGSN